MQNSGIHDSQNYQMNYNNGQELPFLLNRNPNGLFPCYPRTHGWQDQEIHKAAIFITQFQNQLQQNNENLIMSLLHSLSQFVFSRNFNQCRKYYQLILRKGMSVYLQQVYQKFPQLDKQRRQYQLLLKCVRQNCALRQNIFNIDFKIKTDDKSVKQNFFYMLRTSNTNDTMITYESSEDQAYNIENNQYKNPTENCINKRRSHSMQKFLDQVEDSDEMAYHQHPNNIYRNDPAQYQFKGDQININFQMLRESLFGSK